MHKKYRETLKNRPVKICPSCNKPIINPKYYKSNVHTTGIKGIRSECQKKRDSIYKKSLPKEKRQNKTSEYKKPKGIFNKYYIKKERDCLKCGNNFKSQSLYNRICERCKKWQPDIISLNSISLETHNIYEKEYD
jgi:hypothetical protein